MKVIYLFPHSLSLPLSLSDLTGAKKVVGEFAFEKGNPLLCCTAVKRREREEGEGEALYLSIHSGGQICSSAGHGVLEEHLGLT